MGMDILLVEGNARRRVAIGQHLASCGHRVTISSTIGEAQELLHFVKYKVEAPNAVIVAENLLANGGTEFRAELGARFPATNWIPLPHDRDLEWLAAAIAETPAAAVLDLGCGAGHASFAAAAAAREVVAYDLTEAMLRVVEQAAADRGLANIRTAQGRAERLPFADASFDWVISRYSAHHWQIGRAHV